MILNYSKFNLDTKLIYCSCFRFPWIAFFAMSHIRAGTELTWDYNYVVGSVSNKVMYCYCGTKECRGRLL